MSDARFSESLGQPLLIPKLGGAGAAAHWGAAESVCGLGAWGPGASGCGNFSDTSSLKFPGTKGSRGHAFTVCIHTENQNQMSFYPFVPREISVLTELILGHLRYFLTDVPPQPNSPPDYVFSLDRWRDATLKPESGPCGPPLLH